MSKLSTAQIQALHEINTKVAVDLITAKSVTITSLYKRDLIYKGSYIGGVPAWYLTDAGKAAIGLSDNEDQPRLDGVEEIAPGESVEVTGTYAGGHSQEQILELLGEDTPESVEVPVFKPTRRMVREARRNIARYNRRLMRLQGKRTREYGVENVIIKFIAA